MSFLKHKLRSPFSKYPAKAVKVNKGQAFDGNHSVELNLGSLQAEFRNGKWFTAGVENATGDKKELYELIKDLKEENNLLKLKVEILTDMVAEAASKSLE